MFDAAFFINLDHRIDRKNKFLEKAKLAKLDNVIRFPAISVTDEQCLPDYYNQGEKRKYKVGCTLSHQAVVKQAKEMGLENVLIFEDDCVFLDDFYNVVETCSKELKTLDEWSVMYFGGEPSNHCTPITENIYTITNGGVYCCHAYAVNHTFYDKILEINPIMVDVIDIALLNYSIHHRKFMLSKKLVAVQEDYDFSELEQHNLKAATGVMQRGWQKYITESIYNI